MAEVDDEEEERLGVRCRGFIARAHDELAEPGGSEDPPQPLPPRLAPLLQPPQLQRDRAANPLLIAAG
jgi:hypothetical protein